MRIICPALLTAGLLASTPTLAALPEDARLDVMPYFTRVDGSRKQDRQAGGFRASYNWGLTGNWSGEVQAFSTFLSSDLPGDGRTARSAGTGFDIVYNFADRTGYTPYLLGGLGAVYDDAQGYLASDTNAFVNVAAGVISRPLSVEGVKFRAEVRYVYDDFGDGMNDWQLGLGFSIPLCCESTTVAMAPPPAAAPMPVEAPPQDSDGDGVYDEDDRCPDTLPGARVNREGCVEANETIRLDAVRFEFNSDRLTPAARNDLLGAVRALSSQPNAMVEIAGHTDSRGNDDYNRRLSQKRADAVRAFLIQNGIPADRLSANGYGESQPVAPNDTDSGRAMNRRVEMRFR